MDQALLGEIGFDLRRVGERHVVLAACQCREQRAGRAAQQLNCDAGVATESALQRSGEARIDERVIRREAQRVGERRALRGPHHAGRNGCGPQAHQGATTRIHAAAS